MAIQSNTLWICDARDTLLQSRGGSVRCAIAYTCHGWRKPNAVAPALGFNGQRAEPLTEWYYLGHGHRVYNTTLMRFHSPDRLSPFEKGGLNAYVYCSGDPINHRDPTGQFIESILRAVAVVRSFIRHTRNITGLVFIPRPKSVVGGAKVAMGLGSVATVLGGTMTHFDFAAGAAVTAAGSAAVGVGTSVIAVHNFASYIRDILFHYQRTGSFRNFRAPSQVRNV